jgi:hypothetical protein
VARNTNAALTIGAMVAAAVGSVSFSVAALAAEAAANAFPGGKAGFVVSHFAYALARDASESGACPEGMTSGYKNFGDVFVGKPELQRQPDEVEDKYIQRVFRQSMSDPNAKNLCLNPELGKPDPNWRSVKSADLQVDGIDLDGQDSRARGKPARNTCAHDDFRGTHGERGIDNQFYRLVGCSKSFQSTGQSNTFEIEMYTGSWGILLTLSGVDSTQNDPDVEVGLYANADPLQLSPTREALPNSTYAVDQDPRYQAKAHGRIVNGVLSTDPVDVRLHWVVNSIRLDRPLQDARLRMSFTPDGGLEGILAGYTNLEDLYDFQYGFRNGKDGAGKPAPLQLRQISSIGQAAVLNHTCNGAYFEMKQLADGHRDPATGQCTSISMQYRLKVIPAFVVNTATKSVNAALDEHAPSTY